MCDKEQFIGAYSPCFHQHHEMGGERESKKEKILGSESWFDCCSFSSGIQDMWEKENWKKQRNKKQNTNLTPSKSTNVGVKK